MLESHPVRSPGVLFGLLSLAGLLLLLALLALFMLAQPFSLMSVGAGFLFLLSLPAFLLVAYITGGLRRARYHVAGNALHLHWGDLRHAIPLPEISEMVWGDALPAARQFRGIRWPGLAVGSAQIQYRHRAWPLLLFASRPQREQLILFTGTRAFALSPADRENFRACLIALRATAQSPSSEEEGGTPVVLAWPLWRDRLAHALLALPAGLNLLLFAYLGLIYGRLPSSVPLHFDLAGQVDRVGAPLRLLLLPAIGLLAWLSNGLLGLFFYQWRGEKLAAALVWATASVIQVATWLAVFGLLLAL